MSLDIDYILAKTHGTRCHVLLSGVCSLHVSNCIQLEARTILYLRLYKRTVKHFTEQQYLFILFS